MSHVLSTGPYTGHGRVTRKRPDPYMARGTVHALKIEVRWSAVPGLCHYITRHTSLR